jgi:hypothetical protein
MCIKPMPQGKFGTPKCEYIMQLIRNNEPENYPGCWVGAHPRLGEDIVKVRMKQPSNARVTDV